MGIRSRNVGESLTERQKAAAERFREQYKAGNTPLDRVEKICREYCILSYCEFIDIVFRVDPELALWAPSKWNIAAKTRGISGRIAKIKKEQKAAERAIATKEE